jgi:excisionase family DNA binding protein
MTEDKMKQLLIDIRQLSELTGFPVGTLYHFISEKRIPVVRFSSRCVRFRVSDIEAWIEEKVEQSKCNFTPARQQLADNTNERGEDGEENSKWHDK